MHANELLNLVIDRILCLNVFVAEHMLALTCQAATVVEHIGSGPRTKSWTSTQNHVWAFFNCFKTKYCIPLGLFIYYLIKNKIFHNIGEKQQIISTVLVLGICYN